MMYRSCIMSLYILRYVLYISNSYIMYKWHIWYINKNRILEVFYSCALKLFHIAPSKSSQIRFVSFLCRGHQMWKLYEDFAARRDALLGIGDEWAGYLKGSSNATLFWGIKQCSKSILILRDCHEVWVGCHVMTSFYIKKVLKTRICNPSPVLRGSREVGLVNSHLVRNRIAALPKPHCPLWQLSVG